MVSLVMFSLMSVICDGPGYLPLKWKQGQKGECLVSHDEDIQH